MRVDRVEDGVGIVATDAADQHFGHPLPADGRPSAEAIGDRARAVDDHIASDAARLEFDNAIEVGNARNRIDFASGPMVAKIIGYRAAHGFDARPSCRRIVVNRDEDFERDGLRIELNARFGERFFVLGKHKFRFSFEVAAECRRGRRGAAGLVIGPRAVFDFAIAKSNVFALDGFDFHFKKCSGIGESLRVGEAGHAIGFERATGRRADHGGIDRVKRIAVSRAIVAPIRRRGPKHIGFVHIAPVRAPACEARAEVFNCAKPLCAEFVGILRAHIAARFNEAHDLGVVVGHHDFGCAGKNGDGFVADDVNVCHK